MEVEVRVEGDYNVQLLMPGSNEISVNAEQLVPISSYIKVKNLAKVNDLIYVTAEWELGGNDWTLETPQPISLASNAEKSLFISVKAPKADAGGQATLKIRVESGGDSSKYDEQNIIFRVNTAQDSSGPQTEELGEESSLGNITNLYLVHKQLGKEYDIQEINRLIAEADQIDYRTNFSLFRLLDDNLYLEKAYAQIEEKGHTLTLEIFLVWPIVQKHCSGSSKLRSS